MAAVPRVPRRARTVLAIGALAVLVPTPASAHPVHVWTLNVGPGPVGRVDSAMVYHPGSQTVLMFGGCSSSPCPLDTWSWNGTTWTQLTPATSPTHCPEPSMVHDTTTSLVVLTCGYGSTGTSITPMQTWTWDGSTWTDRTAAVRPPGRHHYALTYDANRGRIILFGGRSIDAPLLNDVWEFNSTLFTWSLRLANGASGSPSARYATAFAYDPARGETVIFGGLGSANNGLTETWGFDASNLTTPWTLRATTGPPARSGAMMAFDTNHAQTILHGGFGPGVILGDTWAWDGTTWLPQPAGGPFVYWSSMAYDRPRQDMVLFSGSPAVPTNTTSQDTYLYG